MAGLLSACAADAQLYPCPRNCLCTPSLDDECGHTVVCDNIETFPNWDEYPNKVDCIFLSSSKLGGLSADAKERGLRNLPSTVRRLDLSQCGLGELPAGDALGRLKALRVLNLEFNRLRKLPRDVFHGLDKLKVLWLTGNHYNPDEREYKKMKALGNRLAELDSDQFRGLANLQVLLLHHNRFKALPPGLFDGLDRLKVLKLLDNRFKPEISRSHPAFSKLLHGGASPVLYQLDIDDDSGDDLEDHWEQTHTYLSDEFDLKPPPRSDL